MTMPTLCTVWTAQFESARRRCFGRLPGVTQGSTRAPHRKMSCHSCQHLRQALPVRVLRACPAR